MPPHQVILILDSSASSPLLIRKYNQDKKLLHLFLHHSHAFIECFDDFPLLIQALRMCFNGTAIFPWRDLYIPQRWKLNRELILFLASCDTLKHFYSKFEDYGELMNDPEIMMCIMASSRFHMCSQFEKYVHDGEFMLRVCEMNGHAIRYVPKELRTRELALVSIRSCNIAFQYCHELLDSSGLCVAVEHESCMDRGFILSSIEKEDALRLLERFPNIYDHLPNALKEDYQILEMAVSKKCRVLQHAPISLRNDREFVLKCVRNFRNELKYADGKFLSDAEVVYESLKDTTNEDFEYSNLKEIHPELKKDKRILLEYLKYLFKLLSHSPIEKNLHHLIEDVMDIIEKDRELSSWAYVIYPDYFLQSNLSFIDEEFILEVLKRNSWRLKKIPISLSQNEQFMIEMVKNGFSYSLVDETIRFKRDFTLTCIKHSNMVSFSDLSPDLKLDKEIVVALARKTKVDMAELNDSLRSDRDVLIGTIQYIRSIVNFQMISSLDFIEECVRTYQEFKILDFLKMVKQKILQDSSAFLRLFLINPKILSILQPDRKLLELAIKSYPEHKIMSLEREESMSFVRKVFSFKK